MIRSGLHIFFLLYSILITFSCLESPNKQSIYGSWEGEHNGKELLFQFKNNQTCILSFKDKVTGSVEILSGNFEIDFTKKPTSLSIRNIPQLNYPLHTIVEFRRDDVIRVANFSTRWRLRPLWFDNNTSMKLKRVNEKLTKK